MATYVQEDEKNGRSQHPSQSKLKTQTQRNAPFELPRGGLRLSYVSPSALLTSDICRRQPLCCRVGAPAPAAGVLSSSRASIDEIDATPISEDSDETDRTPPSSVRGALSGSGGSGLGWRCVEKEDCAGGGARTCEEEFVLVRERGALHPSCSSMCSSEDVVCLA
jgi:hypothetical protein